MSIVEFLKSEPHLKERLPSLQESFSKNIQALSFTGYVLKQRVFSEEDYFSWAQRTYQLPWVKNDFFHLHSPESGVWEQWKDFYAWRPDCIPLAQWDGMLFVGCLEKPADWPTTTNVCFILSTLSCLEAWYGRYISGNLATSDSFDINTAPAPTPVAAPEPVIPVAQTPPPSAAKKSEPTDLLELVDEVTPEEGEDGAPKEEIEVLEGFEGLTGAGPAPDLFGEVSSEKSKAPKLEFNSGGPVLATPPAPVAPVAPPPTPVNLNKTATGIKIPVSPTVTTKNPPAPPSAKATLPPTMPPPQKPIVPPATPLSGKTSATQTGIKAPALPSAPKGEAHFLNEFMKLNAALTGQFKVICDPLKTHFLKYMILSVDEKRSEVSPAIWSESFMTDQQQGQYKISITSPCIFSIVANTFKPFHGYITPNDINEKFFEDWNQGQLPEHATIVPVIFKDQLIGMMMAIGEKSAFNPQALRFVEKIVLEINKKMDDSKAKAA